MAGLDLAIHANATWPVFAWIPGTRPGMTVVVPGHKKIRELYEFPT
jgi:hypothetical protein